MTELFQWDGTWYIALAAGKWLPALPSATGWYPDHVIAHHWTTLGFFPLYTILMWGTGQISGIPYVYSGLIVSLITGAIATVLIWRLAERWFGELGARRGIKFFCLFPGSIVFSMDYTEGLLLTLIAGCMLALEHRRWLLAGILAGFATAVGPVSFAIVPALAVAAILELRRRGPGDRRAWRALLAPLLAPAGLIGFGGYLWVQTGTPFASFIAQRDAWHEHTSPLALYSQAKLLVKQVFNFHDFNHPTINLNYIAGLIGAAFMFWALRYVWRARRRLPVVALVWTAGVALLTVTSAQVPPNPRMLLCAFPLLLTLAAELSSRGYRRLLIGSTIALLIMSPLTFVSNALRP
jgi:hypothetical protein